MNKAIVLISTAALAALIAGAGTGVALAQERYQIKPSVGVSADLSAPWVMQLQTKPSGATQGAAAQRAQRQALIANREVQLKRQFDPGYNMRTQPRTVVRTSAPTQAMAAPRSAGEAESRGRNISPAFEPTIVEFQTNEAPGNIIIDTNQRYLYFVLGNGKAKRYGVGVGKPGFEWAGTHKVTRKAEWPGWTPPPEMIAREKAKGRILPAHMPGGPENPLGARAMYLGSTLYRIHGTNQPWTIGQAVSSGCIRMRNEDVVDLYERVRVGAKVRVI